MERKVFFRFRDHLRCVVNGKPLLCKACNTHIRFDPVTQQELRHLCGVEDHPIDDDLVENIGDPSDADWEDDDVVEDPLSVGERIAFAEDVAGYGEDLREFTDMRPRGEW